MRLRIEVSSAFIGFDLANMTHIMQAEFSLLTTR